MRRLPLASGAPGGAINKILAVGRNYAEHAAEMQAPAEPVIFSKPPTALRMPGEPVRLPRDKGAVHFEAELVVWLAGGGTALTAEASAQLPGAVGLGLDLTLRDVQAEAKQAGRPWTLSKGFDGALPLGRFVEVTRLGPIGELAFALEVNGAPRQRGEASDMLLSVPELLAYISGWITLEPGDLVLTGTPKGVGPVLPGDTARLVLEGWHDDLVRFV